MTTTSTINISQSQCSAMLDMNSNSCQFSLDKVDDDTPKVQFPKLLHNLISNTDDAIVSWNHQGSAFCINDEEQFMEIAQQCFKLKQSRTFTRRLRMWGFQRVGRGNATTYQHVRFHRDFISLCRGMKRTKTAKACSKKASCTGNDRAASWASEQPARTSADCTSHSVANMRVLDVLNVHVAPLSVPMLSSQNPPVLDKNATATDDFMTTPLTEDSSEATSKSSDDTRSLSSLLCNLSQSTTMTSLAQMPAHNNSSPACA